MSLTAEGLVHHLKYRLGLKSYSLDATTSLFNSRLLDSVSILDLITFIESEAGVEIEPEDITLDNIDSVERIMNLVRSKQQAQTRTATGDGDDQ